MAQRYQAPDNDNITRAFEAVNIIKEEHRGSDLFLDVVNWNIRYFHHKDKERLNRIVDILSVINADIIVLQEILEGSLDPVCELLAERGAGYYQVAYGSTGGNQRIAIMWDLDWIRSKDEVKELAGKKQVIAENNKDAFPRLPLWGYFTSRSNLEGSIPFDFQLVGLHLKSQRGGGGEQRKAAGDWLAGWLKDNQQNIDSDVILLGDWNENPCSESWNSLHELEENNEIMFNGINNEEYISHLYYKNKKHLGSLLDLAAVSVAAYDQIEGDPEVIRWVHIDEFLDAGPKATEIKAFLKDISNKISDHMPVITRFQFEERGEVD